MGLRCLLGHNFGEPELEREREEQGNEVVITVREVKTCQRCGEQQIVSENKEVTSIQQLADEADAAEAEAERGAAADERTAGPGAEPPTDPADHSVEPSPGEGGPNTTSDSGVTVDPGTDTGAELIEDDPGEPTGTDATEPGPDLSGVEADATGTDDGSEPTEESGVEIISESADETPLDDASDDGVSTAADANGAGAWPEVDASDDNSHADAQPDDQPVEDDGVILDEEADSSGDRGYGEWPSVTEADEPERPSDPTPWPEHHGEDEGFDATVGDEADDEDEDAVDVSFGGGLTPESEGSRSAEEDVEFIDSGPSDATDGASADSGGTAPGSDTDPTSVDPDPTSADSASIDPDPTTDPTSTDADHDPAEPSTFGNAATPDAAASNGTASNGAASNGAAGTPTGPASNGDFSGTKGAELTTTMNEPAIEYFCPECGMSQAADGGSMRAGDICPECKRGYVTERSL